MKKVNVCNLNPHAGCGCQLEHEGQEDDLQVKICTLPGLMKESDYKGKLDPCKDMVVSYLLDSKEYQRLTAGSKKTKKNP